MGHLKIECFIWLSTADIFHGSIVPYEEEGGGGEGDETIKK